MIRLCRLGRGLVFRAADAGAEPEISMVSPKFRASIQEGRALALPSELALESICSPLRDVPGLDAVDFLAFNQTWEVDAAETTLRIDYVVGRVQLHLSLTDY